MVVVVEGVSHPPLSALGVRNRGCSFPIPEVRMSGRVKNSFILKDLCQGPVRCVICIFYIPCGSKFLTSVRCTF